MSVFEFYRDRNVLVTGHTGFKGSWMCRLLALAGAKVTGYALKGTAEPDFFEVCQAGEHVFSEIGDVRDLEHLKEVFDRGQPEIVIHMAAQPLVRESYRDPVHTYETNVMGTVNVMECVRLTPSVRSVVNVTTDKVYRNREWAWGYREDEELNGFDPYSNSKSCSELVTSSYVNSFFRDRQIAVSTCRAGNVIGGGDFAADRIIPDCVRAARAGKEIALRNPHSTRPYQHVLEPLRAYLSVAEAQYYDKALSGSYNVGPNEPDCRTTGELAGMFCTAWEKAAGNALQWVSRQEDGPHEANFLKLDCSKIKNIIGWRPVWDVETAVQKTVEWWITYLNGGDIARCMDNQMMEFFNRPMDSWV
ncbi:MAG: CDP-glucose 4,6-dehydratase [Lachnospiraceae bacterium]|nr:CDP-glucose 4,6-dehydratase [Lachnospiraceae bacterium]